MAAGLTTFQIVDAAGTSRTMQFWSSDGTATGTLAPYPVKATATARLLSAANTTNATSVKATAGNLNKITGWNAGTITYLKLYNLATAPTVGTSVPVWTEYLPASAKFDFNFDGLYFGTGIAYALTTIAADNDATAVAAAAVLALNITYS